MDPASPPAPRHPLRGPRPPLPARRGHALGRRPGRLVRAGPLRRRPARRRLRGVLRRPVHGRVGRRAHRRPPAGGAARPERRLLDGRHGRPRGRRDGLGRARPGGRPLDGAADHLHELVGHPEGLRRPQRRCRVHVLERRRRGHLGAGAGRQGALLPRPAPRPQHRRRPRLRPGRHPGLGPAPRPRRPRGRRREGGPVPALEGPLLGPPAVPAGSCRGVPGGAPGRGGGGAPGVQPRGGRPRRRGRLDRRHHPLRRPGAGRHGDRDRHRDPPRAPARRRAP